MIHGERLVDDTPHIRVSLADVELPNHVRFTQYVFRMRRCAMTVVLDDAGERVPVDGILGWAEDVQNRW